MKNASEAANRAAMNQVLPPELFSGLLAIAADAVIAVDEEQRIIFFNEGAEQIFGWTADEVGGKSLEMLLPERHRSAHRGHVSGFGAAHGHARQMGDRQQISGQRKSGEEFGAEAAIERIMINGKNVYAAVLRDISARQRAENLLHQAIKARDDMVGIVSHDLRNPANAVKMLARSIMEGSDRADLADSVIERIAVIQQAAEQMDALIEDLLDITRLEAGRLTVTRETMEVGAAVERQVEAMRPIADSCRVTMTVDIRDAPTRIEGDPHRLGQVLSNLLGNAIKFSAAGGNVSIIVRRSAADVTVSVADRGEGIPADQLAHVFDRFYQGDAGSSRPPRRHGAGLGLPIARGIVEAHGGRIWIESTLGVGTTAWFTVPRR